MLPKSERLTKQDFSTFKPNVVFRGTYVDVSSIPSSLLRFACVISKKRIKRAVDRNKARRKIYHLLQKTRPTASYLVVIYPKQAVLSGNRALIEEELRNAFATL